MKRKERKEQVTLRVSGQLYRRAKQIGRDQNRPLAVVLADAAERTLLPPPDRDPIERIETTGRALLNRLAVLDDQLGRDLLLLREMLGIAVRLYLNHTPEIPESERDAAHRSGRQRFTQYARHVRNNAKEGASILDEHLQPAHRRIEDADDAA